MNTSNLSAEKKEKKTLIIVILTIITMIAEIVFGYITNSMALLADGLHMGTHALALGLTYSAYVISRYFSNSAKFPNGTDKIGTLAGYTSSLFLLFTGIWIIYEATLRFLNPLNILFNDAIIVAVIGLIVNGFCILIMDNHEHIQHKEHCHKDSKNNDYNFISAYYHILADALTSILAIFALIAGKYFNIIFLDTIVGLLGGFLIIKWSISLIKDTVIELIDMKH